MPALGRRRLGRTGLVVTEVGLGAMDTSQSPEGADALRAALGLGINIVDTAREYEGSELLIGHVIRDGVRREFHVASKTFSRAIDGSQRDIDRSLSMLGVERISLYQLHDVSTVGAWREVMGSDGALRGMRIARHRGLIGHIGLSTHSLEVAREAICSGAFDTVMLEYSAFHPESAPLIELARARDVGVIAMRPLGGSGRTSVMRTRIETGTAGILTPANLIRYVLSNPGVSVAIPGARYPSHVRENVATATSFQPIEHAQRRELEEAAAALY